MRRAALALALGMIPAAAGADPAIWVFEWTGGGGYSMTGAMSYDTEDIDSLPVRETDLQCFVIEGFLEGERLGGWGLGQLTLDTTWTLTFDPLASAFVVYGQGAPMPQAWNMDGIGNNCGEDGFGFNIGNAAQDLCHDNRLLYQSQVIPTRPFPATRVDSYDFPQGACRQIPLIGMLGG